MDIECEPGCVGAAQLIGSPRLIAYLGPVISEWALWCGILVYAYEHSGKTVAGLVSIGLFLPGALIAPLAGAAADGPCPNRVLALVYAGPRPRRWITPANVPRHVSRV